MRFDPVWWKLRLLSIRLAWSRGNYRLRAWVTYLLRRHRCENCGTWRGVELRPGRTMYPYEGPDEAFSDPNRQIGLCPSCAEKHDIYWDDMWTEVER